MEFVGLLVSFSSCAPARERRVMDPWLDLTGYVECPGEIHPWFCATTASHLCTFLPFALFGEVYVYDDETPQVAVAAS